jgi:hypothetical protein
MLSKFRIASLTNYHKWCIFFEFTHRWGITAYECTSYSLNMKKPTIFDIGINYQDATTLPWRNKAIMLLSPPNTNNIENGEIGVFSELSSHELYSQEEI